MGNKQLLIIFGILFLLAGCGGQKKIINKYYLIDKPDNYSYSSVEQQDYLKGFCEISPVQIYPAYNSQKIAIKTNSREIIYYGYHFWSQRPGESFTLLLEDYFTYLPIFSGVSTQYRKITPTYKLLTTLYHLELIDQDNEAVAHISLEFRLSDYAEKEILITHKADRKQLLENKDLNQYAIAVSELFYDELNTFSAKIIASMVKQGQKINSIEQ